LAAEYGVPQRTIDSISDAVTIKMMHDYAKLKAAVKAAKADVKPLRSDSPKAQRTSATPISAQDKLMQQAKIGSQSDKLAAISALIRH
jgi:hypothetical protein